MRSQESGIRCPAFAKATAGKQVSECGSPVRPLSSVVCPLSSGFTLVEVLLAAAIVGMGLSVLTLCASRCLAVMRASKEYHNAQWILALGQLEHPVSPTNDVTMFEVEPTVYQERYTFSREVEPDDDDDRLYVLRTRVTWSSQGRETYEEIVRYVLETPNEEDK